MGWATDEGAGEGWFGPRDLPSELWSQASTAQSVTAGEHGWSLCTGGCRRCSIRKVEDGLYRVECQLSWAQSGNVLAGSLFGGNASCSVKSNPAPVWTGLSQSVSCDPQTAIRLPGYYPKVPKSSCGGRVISHFLNLQRRTEQVRRWEVVAHEGKCTLCSVSRSEDRFLGSGVVPVLGKQWQEGGLCR